MSDLDEDSERDLETDSAADSGTDYCVADSAANWEAGFLDDWSNDL